MKTHGYLPVAAMGLGVAVTLMFGTPRPARAASKTGKIIGAVVAGALLYELLDDDDDNHYRRRGHYRYQQPRYQHRRQGRYAPDPYYRAPRGYQGGYYYDGYGDNYRGGDCRPYRGRNHSRYRAPHGRYSRHGDGLSIDVHRGPHGRASVGLGYHGR